MRNEFRSRWRRLPAGMVFAVAVLAAVPGAAYEDEQPDPEDWGAGLRTDEFAGWFHDAGNLLLHVSNRGFFGRRGADLSNPSAEWPAGTNNEYLYAAGLWVGGVVQRGGIEDTLVSAGLYQTGEFRNRIAGWGCGSPPEGICQTFEGAPSGLRRFDDDGDGLVDEDPLDGEDNDGDGRVDEDFAGISQQMFRTVYYDTSVFYNQFWSDQADFHRPLGLEVIQESYQWTDPLFDDFVGVEFRVKNISQLVDGIGWDVNRCYIGFMIDGDVGIDDRELEYWNDDQGAFARLDTTVTTDTGEPIDLSLTMGYIYDDLEANPEDNVNGYIGVMFLGHTTDSTFFEDPTNALAPGAVGIHAYRVWSGGDQDPRDDLDRYRFLRGLYDTSATIDAATTRATDYRFLVSAGPFAKIPPGSTLTFQVAFVCGEMVERYFPELDVTRRVPDLTNPIQAQRVYDGYYDPEAAEWVRWATSSPPPPPRVRVTPGDKNVIVEWDDFPEDVPDPLTRVKDFAGYQVWKAEGWRRESNIPSDEMWRLIADFDSTELSDVDTGLTGIGKYRYVDTRVQCGFWYWYAVTAYDKGTFRTEIDTLTNPSDPETTYVRTGAPKFGKYSQTQRRVMACPTPTQTLDDVYVVPNPYRANAAWDLEESDVEPTGRRVRFFNLPRRATIRIFTLAGDHVITLEHDADRISDERELGCTSWNLISKNNQDTVSGIYLYHVETPDGQQKIGKFVIIR